MPTSVGPKTYGKGNLVFGYDTGDTSNSFPGIPAVNCARVPTTSGNGNSKGSWSITEVTDGSITPPRKGARVFKFVAGTASNLYRQSGYYYGGGFNNNNTGNNLILGRTSPSNFTTVSEAGKYRWGFWVRGVETNTSNWSISIDIGDKNATSYTVGNKTDWYFIDTVNTSGINSNTYPYDFFDLYTTAQGLTIYIADMGIMRSPGTVDSLPAIDAYPQWVDYGQERSYTAGLKDLTTNSTLNLSNVSFDSDAQIDFDGSADRIDVGLYHLSGSSHSEEVVIYRGSTGTTHGILSDLQYGFFGLYVDSNNRVYYRQMQQNPGQTPQYPSVTIAGTTSLGVGYHHIISIFSKTDGFKLYINGELEASNSTILPFNLSGNRGINHIGVYKTQSASTYSNPFDGRIELVKAYNRALTAEEVKANYNAVKGRFNI